MVMVPYSMPTFSSRSLQTPNIPLVKHEALKIVVLFPLSSTSLFTR